MVQAEHSGSVYTLTTPPNPALTPPPGVSSRARFTTQGRRISGNQSILHDSIQLYKTLLTRQFVQVIPNFDEPYTLLPYVEITIAGGVILSTLLVAARMYAKAHVMKKYLWEDYFILLGWVSTRVLPP